MEIFKPREGLILQPFEGADRCFAFTTSSPFSAYVLDTWSYVILDSLQTESAENILSYLKDAADRNDEVEVESNFYKTIDHLEKLSLIERH